MTDTLQFNRDDARRLFETIIYPIHLVAIEPDAAKGVQPHGQNFGADREAAIEWERGKKAAGQKANGRENIVGRNVKEKRIKARKTAVGRGPFEGNAKQRGGEGGKGGGRGRGGRGGGREEWGRK